MSTNLIVGAVELVVGYFTGNPQLMALGATTMLSSGNKPPNQQGPRLGDLTVQASTYGIAIPEVHGSVAISGNVIWSTPVRETAHTSEQGGKGGGGGPTTTNYTYTQSYAIGLCKGPITGVRRAWANGKLVYNISDGVDAATAEASAAFAATMRVYTGSETQMPDALIEADKGVGNVPGYRGLAYVVFENTTYLSRNTNWKFEVVSGDSGQFVYLTVQGSCMLPNRLPTALNPFVVDEYYAHVPNTGVDLTSRYSGAQVQALVASGTYSDDSIGIYPTVALPVSDSMLADFIAAQYDEWDNFTTVQAATKAALEAHTPVNTSLLPTGQAFDTEAAALAWIAANPVSSSAEIGTMLSGAGTVDDARDPETGLGNIVKTFSGGHRVNRNINRQYVILFEPNDYKAFAPDGGSSGGYEMTVACSGTVGYGPTADDARTDCRNNLPGLGVYSATNPGTGDFLESTITFVDDGLPANRRYYGTRRINGGAPSAYGLRYTCTISAGALQPVYYVSYYDSSTLALTADPTLTATSILTVALKSTPVLVATPLALSVTVSNLCQPAGLTVDEIDVTSLASDTVDGYVTQRSTARSKIEPLMQAYYFDAVESGGKVKFVKRGGASAVTIEADDLAAVPYGSAPTDPVQVNRKQEMELPVEIAIQYMDTAADYNIGTQMARRIITDSENKNSINMALAMSATKAKQIADVLMYDAWTGRTTLSLSTGWKYSWLEPTDVVTLNVNGVAYAVRLVEEDSSGGVWRWNAVFEDANVYTQTAPAAALPPSTGTVTLTPQTDMRLLDIPLLRDQDDGYGFYAAACGLTTAGWTGAQNFKSNDGGASWLQFGNAFLTASTIGDTTDALGDYAGGWTFDETNSVTVLMVNGTLSSSTRLGVMNGANAALIGNEVVKFRDATLVAAGTYKLTGLLRGLRGTEWARSTHTAGERFVLLDPALLTLFPGASSEYNLERMYRGVSFGKFLNDVADQPFTHTAVAQKPYAPVHLGGGRSGAGDIAIKWTRRTRIGGDPSNFANVPLGETSEAYEVEICSNSGYGTVLRTITGLTSPTATYTAAQQVADFGSPQSTVYFKVYQISATVGRGYEARGVI